MDKKGFEKVVVPELVKFDDKNKEIIGEFVSLERSKKYEDSMALTFREDNVLKMVFVNQVGSRLLETAKLKDGDEFILTFIGMKDNLDKTQKYMDFDLKVKRK